jgi:ribose transport system permease protein
MLDSASAADEERQLEAGGLNDRLGRLARQLGQFAVPLVLVLMCVVLSIAAPRFLDYGNVTNVLEQVSVTGIVAMGMTALLVTGNFDLSIGGIVALTGMFAAKAINAYGEMTGVLVAVLVGAGLGAVNGFIVTRLGVNSLIATLGSGLAFSGIALNVSGPYPIGLESFGLMDLVAWRLFGIAFPVYVLAAVTIFTAWLLHLTVLGRRLYAVGANTDSARYAGIKVKQVQFLPFVITGVFCALASLILCGQLGSALPDAGSTLPLSVIAAVVVGGVSIAGGRGTVGMAIVGVLLIGVVSNGFNLLNLNSNYTNIFTGAILVIAVAIDHAMRTRRA